MLLSFVRLVGRLPLSVLHGLATLLAKIAWLAGYRKKVVLSNIRASLPELSVADHEAIAKKFYLNLADIIVEVVHGEFISKKQLAKQVSVSEVDLLDEATRQYGTIIVLTAHQGNWEWALAGTAVVGYFNVSAAYKPLHNQPADTYMKRLRSQFGSEMIPTKEVIPNALKHQDNKRVFALMADQAAHPMSSFWTTFMNRPAPFFSGGMRLAKSLQCPVFYSKVLRTGRGQYQVSFEQIAQPPYNSDEQIKAIQLKYIDRIERTIRRATAQLFVVAQKMETHHARRQTTD